MGSWTPEEPAMLSQEVIIRRWRSYTTEPAVFLQNKSHLPGYISVVLTAAKTADSLSGQVPRVWGGGGVGGQHMAERGPLPPFTPHHPAAPLLHWCRTTSCGAMSALLNGKGPLPDWSYA